MLKEIRKYLRQKGAYALIIGHDDAFQSEMLRPEDERLACVTGFTGSAGLCIVTAHQCLLFVDGRYVLQAQQQTACRVIEVPKQGSVSDWLNHNIRKKRVVLYDPHLHTQAQVQKWTEVIASKGGALRPTAHNVVDALWTHRPRPQAVHVYHYPLAGRSMTQKLVSVQKKIRQMDIDAFVVCACASVSWLLNKRSNEVFYTPVYRQRIVVPAEGQPHIVNRQTLALLKGAVVGIDPAQTPAFIVHALVNAGASVKAVNNPLSLMQAIKNPTEIAGMRKAALLDSRAFCRLLYWIEKNKASANELSVVQALEAFRMQDSLYCGHSFAPISAVGKNAAVVHYQPTQESCRALKTACIYLLDAGGQYQCGTTDMTRTLALKTPTDEMKKRYTQVLKGHIALASAVFPAGTTGAQLDTLARQFLWQDGVDYAHGTGHGIGAFLNVHETPPSISPGAHSALQAHMILSDEPGFYLPDRFGLRIENMLLVNKCSRKNNLCFEPLTLVPFCHALIDFSMLTEAEKAWMKTYYQKIIDKVLPLIPRTEGAWLKSQMHLP